MTSQIAALTLAMTNGLLRRPASWRAPRNDKQGNIKSNEKNSQADTWRGIFPKTIMKKMAKLTLVADFVTNDYEKNKPIFPRQSTL